VRDLFTISMNSIVFPSTTYIDFHTHRKKYDGARDVIEIISWDYNSLIEKPQLFTISVHPWFIKHSFGALDMCRISDFLNEPNCIGLGEIGLDKTKGPDLNTQREVLTQVLEIPSTKPVIFHCVKAFEEIIKLKSNTPNNRNWCIHGFNKSPALAEQLISNGFYLSIGKNAIQTKPELFNHIPLERLFLETDDDETTPITKVYDQVSRIKKIHINQLMYQIAANASKFYNDFKSLK
jgi:TatD DNase family protein